MIEDRKAYHERRAATQRRMAALCDDTTIARAHIALAELHEARARDTSNARPMLRVVMPG